MPPAVLQTNWFIGSILTELAFIFTVRTKISWLRARRPSGILTVLVLLTAGFTVILPFTPAGQAFFRFQPPTLKQLVLIFGIVAAYFVTSEQVKLLYYRISQNLHPLRSTQLS